MHVSLVNDDVTSSENSPALEHTDATYQSADEYEEDKKFWQAYAQPLKRFAYTQRKFNSLRTTTVHRKTMTLDIAERHKLQQAAEAMNISESAFYIGASALLFRSLLDREYVSLSLPFRRTNSTMNSDNVLLLLLHIPEHKSIQKALLQTNQDIKSVMKHRNFRVEDILGLANYNSAVTFGPYVNILSVNDGEENHSNSFHFDGNSDVNDLQITFCAYGSNGRLEILIEDTHEAHSLEQLAALTDHLAFILDQMTCAADSTVAALIERCSAIKAIDLCESFYVNRRKPIAAGFLQWNRDCDFLVRLVHSNTWVGSGASPYAVSKVLLIDRHVSISRLEYLSDAICSQTPGTVLKIEKNSWQVAAADGMVEISHFFDEFGQPISAETLAAQCKIIEGVELPILTPKQVEWLCKAYTRGTITEPYWAQRLANFNPCRLSFVESSIIQSPTWAVSTHQPSNGFSAIDVLAAWLIYIARDTEMSQIQIGWDATEHCAQDIDASSLTCIFARTVPFETIIDVNDTFSNVVFGVKQDYKQLADNLPCLSDTLFRRNLNSTNDLSSRRIWSLAVSLIDTILENCLTTEDVDELVSHGNLMTLQINKNSGTFRWIYDTNRISEDEVNRISSRLLVLLASAHSDEGSKKPVAKLDLLPEAERDLLLCTWNQSTLVYPPARCLHQLFEAQVDREGQSIAVDCSGEILSYMELNSQANRLAHYLITRGVKPDDRIAICVDRSPKMIIALLGILKAGGAYVPLDPVYPSQRLVNILIDSKPKFLLADDIGQKTLGDHQIPVIDLDHSLSDDLSIENPDATELGLTPNHLAYVIYTSGTTGTPKGVMVEHQNLFSLVQTIPRFDVNSSSRILQFASCSFDNSIWEIVLALTSGARLCMPSAEERHTDIALLKYINSKGITHADLGPALFRNTANLSELSGMKVLILGSETPSSSLISAASHRTVVYNVYGLTETTVNATYWRCPEDFDGHSVPIGRPLPSHCRTYLLDSHGELVPLGSEGELYIGGAGVARGYLNRPKLTAKRFLPDPFSSVPAARMYRTGDRARYLPDGNLVYLGRNDQQIKIRGFRIELGEIEAHIVKHPKMNKAVVQPIHGNGSDVRLVAYVLTDTDKSIAQDLRTYLSALLPDYMVPTAYVCLPSLPLTPNGKIDRRALPAPNEEAFAHEQYEAPAGKMEELLSEIWRELLGIEHISRYDNFFALGGHSLLVVRLLTELRKVGLDTTVRDVFNSPNLATLAVTLARYESVDIPLNSIAADTINITPEMLPLITLRQADIDAIVAQVPGGVANIQDIYGLTHLQSGILFHHIKTECGDPYLLTSRLRFNDQKTLERYADALHQVTQRHDILRTIFMWEGFNEPAQVVLREIPSIFTKVTIDDSDESALEQLGHRFDAQHFRLDLTQAPLLRLVAAPTSDGSWMGLQFIHHIIGDHITLERLEAEVHAIIEGEAAELSKPAPFRNLVAQTRLGVDSAEYTRFFSDMLGDIDEPTLPFGLNEVGRDGSDINEGELVVSPAIIGQLREHARNLQISLASICHLAWAQVIARASGREAVVFGTVLLGRLQGGEGNLIMGPTINTLPLRLDIDETSILNAVYRTHTRLSALLMQEHAPLVLVQRCSKVPVAVPLFSALLNYRHKQMVGEFNSSLTGVNFLGIKGRTNYPLILSLDDNDDTMNLSVEVVAPISAIHICAYMQQALVSLANALTQRTEQSIRALSVMPSEERQLLLHTWNESTASSSPARCLHELFEEQTERNGEAIAVECNGEVLSYSELNAQANRLAHHLIARGVKPDDRIALCVERSTAMIVAMLGILKAGVAYVPLDPVYSSQRLTHILKDADPIFLLADTTGRKALGKHQFPVINLDEPLPDDLSIENLDTINVRVTPTHLAYVIYTSGSTGTPKGVMVEHQQVVRHIEITQDKFRFIKQDIWCLFHSISFDISVWEIWSALCNGSQLSVVPYDITRFANEFYDWICAGCITVLTQSPSVLRMLMRAKSVSSKSDHLRYMFVGGEALDASVIMDWYEKNDVVLVNLYGPTETVIDATSWTCDSKISKNSLVPIGRPLSNRRAYLLDSFGEPVPLGAEGELYIGGDGIARGYLNRPELTAERFLPDPFSNDPTARMYRSGDRARYLPDGNLIYLGRIDQQVKVRGFRIELGEIEAHLVTHPRVSEAAVQPYGSGSNARLVAYVVANQETLLAQEIRNYLSALLPDYMIPVAYVCLPSLPLTPNGKIDRRALPAPDDQAFARQRYEAPQSMMERKLADIWREMLGIERISRHDNFFALGGHSLLVVRLMGQLRQIGLDTTVREVFDAPTLTALSTKLTRYHAVEIPPNLITEETTEITPEMLPLISLSQTEIDVIIAQIPGGVVNIQDIYGLAPLQSGILYHHIKSERGDPYLTVSRMQFDDSMMLQSYATALQHVIIRHDILRTVFIWEGLNEPAQIVLRQVPSSLTEITFNDTDTPVLEQLTRRFDPRQYRLDLTQSPLFRLLATPTSDGTWMALQLMHHLIVDHSTGDIMEAEIKFILDGEIEKLIEPQPFRHFVAHARLGITPAEHTRFFTEMLGDIDEPTLPFGLIEVGRDGTEIQEAQLALEEKLNDQLRLHARKLQVSLASIFHLAWAQVLARASGRDKVVFGTVLLGRLQTGEGNYDITGPMMNTLPIRIDIDERSVENAVCQTHARLSTLLAHEHAPLVLAQRCSAVPSGMPLFSALLNYRHNERAENLFSSLPGLCVIDDNERTNYPLILSIEDDGESLGLTPQIISSLSATRICGYMKQALESVIDALLQTPQRPLRTLEVIPLEERKLLLHKWNQITTTASSFRCLHQLFEAQVERDGEAIAVECNGESLTYSELNAQANRLAHYLIAQGVKPDDRIALCVERSIKMLVAIMGILKAGAAYVPLDPVYQSQRLSNILQDAEPIFLLTDSDSREAMGEHKVTVIDLDTVLPADLSIANPVATKLGLTPQHLAYFIYTSGSTGTPKGVMVEHRQVMRLFEVTRKHFDFNKDDKWCLFHSFSFDVSVWEMWGALSNGSLLSIVTARSPDEFNDWICTRGVTVLNQTPSAFKSLMRSKSTMPIFDRLRYLIFAGEEFDPLIAKEWWEKYDQNETVLVNMYGPTETLHATYQRIKTLENAHSIGRPLADLCVYLLDAYGEPVPLAADGDLYIGGAGVARGYLNRPELTAERFLPNPFSSDPTARMYRTGDRARYLPDGNLVFLGRMDQQVKIRGFRIELGEIETRLVEHSLVREAVVQPHGKGSNARLVAYVVANQDKSLAQNLRTYLSKLLPDYMIPAAYVRLLSLPLTPNGKLDRRALPAPDDEAFARQQYEAPQSEMEKKLADIWADLLSIEHISRHDNFFALGGHSLLIVRMLAQLRQMGLDTSVRNVFDSPTLVELSSSLSRYQAVTIPPNLITAHSTAITPEMLPLITLSQAEIDTITALVPDGVANIQDIYGLAPLQHGMLFDHIKAERGDSYLLVSRLKFTDRLILEQYVAAMQRVVERHDILRTVFMWEGLNEPAQIVLRHVPSLLTEITIEDTAIPALEQLSHRFNPNHYRLELTQAPLLRLIAAPTSEGNWVALQLMHHLIIDHSTMQRLQAEVHGIINGTEEELTTPASFRHLVAQARLGANSDEYKRFFTKMLGDIDEPTFPFGLRDVGLERTDISEAELVLSQPIIDQLRAHARKLRVSLASICHLAWAQVLARASGRETVVFGTVLLGRLQAGESNSNIMGPTINTLPLRLDIGESSVEDAVRNTHSRLSALLAHEYALLVLAQRCSRLPTGLPLFSSLLNYRHKQHIEQVTAPLLGVVPLGNEGGTDYPLNLSLDDNDDTLCSSVEIMAPMSAARICAYVEQTLHSMADALANEPQKLARTLTVMPTEERMMLLHTWNQTTGVYPTARCLHELFEEQVERNGDAIAVECNGEVLSYSELNAQANRLAHYLIARGIKPDDLIAICVERSIKMLIAILGILKAGGAYVPLDPVYSSQRLTHILKDADPKILLADATGRKTLENNQVSIVDLDESLPDDLPIENPDVINIGVTPAHLAYIIYTSGSTGTPKGVMIEHRQVVRLFEATHDKFNFNESDKWCLFHSFSFDVSVWEMWGALLNGSQLSIVPYSITRANDDFYDWICCRGITVLNQTPSAFKMLKRTNNISSRSDRLRYVIFAGEELDPQIVKDWNEECYESKTELVNLYGTTETTVHATFQRLETIENASSIGRPLPDLCIYLLDSYGEPVPLGAEGELYIGGAGVARGYLNRPELTAQRFLPNPFSDSPTARMYRTGDRARYLPDGNLVYLGRTDQQVKIRGFRIELGEIEVRLVEHSLVHEAIVQSYGNGSNSHLVAYVVADSNESIVMNLRTYLSSLLPDYMVPAAYVCLPTLPLTPNGKLDRRALPPPNHEAFVRQQYEAPRDGIEEKLAEIWCELLGIDRVSRFDNFFELGGHSLLVMQFSNKAKQSNIHIDARGLFSFPILKELAEQIIDCSNRLYFEFAIPVRRFGDQRPIFILPAGDGDIYYGFELAHVIDKRFPVYVLPWLSPDKKQPLSIEEMASEMIPHMKKVQSHGPYTILSYCTGGILAYEMTKQLIDNGDAVGFLGLIDTFPPDASEPDETELVSDSELFLVFLASKFPEFEAFNDLKWWLATSKLPLNEAIEEVKKINVNVNLKVLDVEWEAMFSKQCFHFQSMCEAYKMQSLPIKVHLFQALEYGQSQNDFLNLFSQKFANNSKRFNEVSMLGWGNYNLTTNFHIVPVNGDHLSMMSDPSIRASLAQEISRCLFENDYDTSPDKTKRLFCIK